MTKVIAGVTQSADRMIFPMAATCGLAVATIYYNQPLLPLMAASFGQSSGTVGLIAMATQLGYALGLILFVPLGDRMDRRRLILTLLLANIGGLLVCSAAPSLRIAGLASLVLGLTAVTAQIVIPMMAGLTAPDKRGRTMGMMLGGLSAGIMLSRSLSGLVGAEFGWRTMYQMAAGIDVMLMIVVWRTLPYTAATTDVRYTRLLASLRHLFVSEPVLRKAAMTGFLLFAAFSAFWSSMATLLARPPYALGSAGAGAFGLLSVAGISLSPVIGRLVDGIGSRPLLFAVGFLEVLAFGLLLRAESGIWMITIVVVLLDVGNRAGIVSCQTKVFSLGEQARSRLNSIFMSFYFLGGAFGAQAGQASVARWGWSGLALTGAGFATLALLVHALMPDHGQAHPRRASRTRTR